MTEEAKNCGHPKLAEAMPVHQNSVPCLLLLNPFAENVARAHVQFAVWKSALEPTPPVLDPTEHGWSKTEGSTTLRPTTIPPETSLAHLDLLKLIKCSCQSQAPCKTQRCRCSSANMPCTSLCVCQGEHEWQNERNEDVENVEDDA